MRTTVNGGEERRWPAWLWALWFEKSDRRPEGTVVSANYFEARPYRNEYDRGSDKFGFVYVIGRQVYFMEWTTPVRPLLREKTV